MRQFIRTVLLLSVIAAPAYTQDATSKATQDIVTAREQVADHVLDIKHKFKESDPEWREGRDLYRKAYAQYSAYITTMKAAIRKGKTNDLAKDSSYKKAAAEASNSARTFMDYADSKTGGKPRAIFLVSMLFNQGINILNAYKAGQAERRAQEAEDFEKDVKWLRWEEIN
jgi:hypothetical protein